jgi:hypothetical protein
MVISTSGCGLPQDEEEAPPKSLSSSMMSTTAQKNASVSLSSTLKKKIDAVTIYKLMCMTQLLRWVYGSVLVSWEPVNMRSPMIAICGGRSERDRGVEQ